MQTIKTRSQESLSHLVDLGKQQPEHVQHWGVTAAAALAGALALTAVAKGVLGVVGTLAYPPVALTVGALGGGIFGWSFMQKRAEESTTSAGDKVDTAVVTAPEPDVATSTAIDAQI